VTFAASPARLHFQVRTVGLRLTTGTVERKSSRRGAVREFSWRSRRRLMERAWDLGELERPDLMLTLTMPAEWRSVCADGRAFKRHVKAWRARLTRHLLPLGVGDWAALWFLEFQARGAPHLHVILWGPGLAFLDVDAMRKWTSESWSEVVGHADPVEREKHLHAGTRVERMRRDHFGYATKYANKMEQKRVPDGFDSVGRFWGFWRYRAVQPAIWVELLDLAEVQRVVRAVAAASASPTFGAKLVERFAAASLHSDTFSATVYGSAAVWAAVDATTSVTTPSGAAPPGPRSGSVQGTLW
jgi:hypothetical protein